MNKDYYQILGIDRNSTESDIKKAYRKLAMEHHPDRNEGSIESEDKFKKIQEAYEVLSDPQKKQQFDQYGTVGGRVNNGFEGFGGFDFSDIFSGNRNPFEDIFTNGFGRQQRQQVRKGQSIRIKVKLNLEEIIRGVKKKIKINRNILCTKCNGTGSKDGKKSECQNCHGTGSVMSIQNTSIGQIRTQTTCPSCHGSGSQIKEKCNSCNGNGLIQKEEIVDIDIPAGVVDGMTLSMNGKGSETPNGTPGDLMILIEEIRHEQFKRQDSDLHCELMISVPDAILGSSSDINTIDGTIRINIEPGTQSGKLLKVKGKGVPHLNSGYRGDLIVKINVRIPSKVDVNEREFLEKLRKSNNFKI